MRSLFLLICVAPLIFLAGCAGPLRRTQMEPLVCASTGCDAGAFQTNYQKTLQYCASVSSGYEGVNAVAGFSELGLKTIGTLAGLVGAQVAQGSAAKVWAGISGATNVVSDNMNTLISASVNVQRQAAVGATVSAGIDTINKVFADTPPPDYQKLNVLLIGLQGSCSLAQDKAVTDAAQLVLKATVVTKPEDTKQPDKATTDTTTTTDTIKPTQSTKTEDTKKTEETKKAEVVKKGDDTAKPVETKNPNPAPVTK